MKKQTEQAWKKKLGDYWECECGEKHQLSGVYLAAHWLESLVHTCPNCKRKHCVQAGEVTLIIENKRRAKPK